MRTNWTTEGGRNAAAAERGRTFQAWMNNVDFAIEAEVGVTSIDLPEWDYAGAYESGVRPLAAAAAALEAAGWRVLK